jgi:Rrf2 family protein
MFLPEGVEWALHCGWLLAHLDPDRTLSSRRMAEFYGLPPAYLSKVLKSLVRAGILEAVTGPRGGFRLARAPEAITVLEIVEAVEGRSPIFRCMEIRQRGPAPAAKKDCLRPCGIAAVMYDAEMAWRATLRQTTVADLASHASSGSTNRAHRWLTSFPQR